MCSYEYCDLRTAVHKRRVDVTALCTDSTDIFTASIICTNTGFHGADLQDLTGICTCSGNNDLQDVLNLLSCVCPGLSDLVRSVRSVNVPGLVSTLYLDLVRPVRSVQVST